VEPVEDEGQFVVFDARPRVVDLEVDVVADRPNTHAHGASPSGELACIVD
jgi:hypothetical protein